jgi:hypothetical protein
LKAEKEEKRLAAEAEVQKRDKEEKERLAAEAEARKKTNEEA